MTRTSTVLGLGIAAALVAVVLIAGAATTDAESDTCELTYDNFGKAFVESYCVACHSSEKTGFARKGAPKAYNFDSVDGIMAELKDVIKHATVKNDMPPAPPKPSDEERAKAKAWLECEYK